LERKHRIGVLSTRCRCRRHLSSVIDTELGAVAGAANALANTLAQAVRLMDAMD
jgi:hypothetical protein